MKNLLKIGNVLNKEEQKEINGGLLLIKGSGCYNVFICDTGGGDNEPCYAWTTFGTSPGTMQNGQCCV